MRTYSLGKVTVAAAGTPVELADVLADLGLDPELRVNQIKFFPLVANTDTTYVGLSGFDKTAGDGLLKEIIEPNAAAGHLESFEIAAQAGGNVIRAADYAVDVAANDEGFTVVLVEV